MNSMIDACVDFVDSALFYIAPVVFAADGMLFVKEVILEQRDHLKLAGSGTKQADFQITQSRSTIF